MLYIVSTPIGNLGDITFRAVDTLKRCNLIVAEDTRRTGILLNKYDIKTNMISYNDHNKKRRIPYLIKLLKENNDISLVSDAGTPGISDPGYNLINECIDSEIQVVPIPGPSAAISALVTSGLPTDSYVFYGFLPKKEKKKKELLLSLKRTMVFYESPHRIKKTLKHMDEVIPGAKVCLAREMTKKFEEFLRGTPSEILKATKDKNIKGEIVLIVNNKD